MPPVTYDVAHSSSLHPRTRLGLIDDNAYEYQRLWLKAYAPTVWERLLEDAGTRQTRRARSKPYQEGCAVPFNHTGSLSGFATNTSKAVYSLTSFKQGLNAELQPSPVTMTHPLLCKRYMQKYRLDYMAAIRPDTETANQTQRMLGTYETDLPHAKKGNVHIAPICPAGEGSWFHPDVRLSDMSYTVAVRAHESMRPRDKMAEMRATRRTNRPASAHPVMQGAQPTSTSAPAAAEAADAPRAAAAGHTTFTAAAAAVIAASPAPAAPAPAAAARAARPASAHPAGAVATQGLPPQPTASGTRASSFTFHAPAAAAAAGIGAAQAAAAGGQYLYLGRSLPTGMGEMESAATPAGRSRPASARPPAQQQAPVAAVAAGPLRPSSARASVQGQGAVDMLRTMVKDASLQPKAQLVAEPQDTISHRVRWGAA